MTRSTRCGGSSLRPFGPRRRLRYIRRGEKVGRQTPYHRRKMGTNFKIESVTATAKGLTIVCKGSLSRLHEYFTQRTIHDWMEKHPEEKVEQIVLDLAGVDDIEDDEPVASILYSIVFWK